MNGALLITLASRAKKEEEIDEKVNRRKKENLPSTCSCEHTMHVRIGKLDPKRQNSREFFFFTKNSSNIILNKILIIQNRGPVNSSIIFNILPKKIQASIDSNKVF